MEKLSSILPANGRVRAVDLADAHPIRPGQPAFGRPVGANVAKDRFTVSQEGKDAAFAETLGAVKPRHDSGAKIADDLSKKFFEEKLRMDDLKGGGVGSEMTQEREIDLEADAPKVTIAAKMKYAEPKTTNQLPTPAERFEREA